jgi:hypothetical protein
MSIPPPTAITSMMTVSIGSMISAARNRGVTSFRTGSTPRVLRASICSVMRIEPSCAAIPEPARPVTMRAVRTGPSSRTALAPTSRPM